MSQLGPNSNQLLPCPFCGGKAALLNNGDHYWVQCLFSDEDEELEACQNREKLGVLWPMHGCLAGATRFNTQEEAIAAWNRMAGQ